MQTECTCVTSKGAKLCNFLPASFLRQLFYCLEIILYLFLMGKSKMCNSYLPFLKRQLQLLHTMQFEYIAEQSEKTLGAEIKYFGNIGSKMNLSRTIPFIKVQRI